MVGLGSCARLNTGGQMPLVGIGTFLLKGDKLRGVVESAIGLGYRLVDTALSYGNEVEIGETVRDLEKSGKIIRKDLFITTKVPPVYLSPKDVQMSIEKSLDNLKMTHVDLLLVHSPWGLQNRGDGTMKPEDKDGNLVYEHYDLAETWRAFEEVFWSGKAKAIGVSNFTPSQILRIKSASKVTPANLQSECNAYLQQRELLDFCKSQGVVFTAFGPIGAPGRPAHHRVGGEEEDLLQNAVVKALAQKHGKTGAQVLLKFLLQRGIAVIPKTQCLARLEENAKLCDFDLDRNDMDTLYSLDKRGKFRFFPFVQFSKHAEYFRQEPF